MISLRLPTHVHAVAFLTSTRLFTLAECLGGVESLVEHPASWTQSGIPGTSLPRREDAIG
jgi:cystathionine gamma-synthase